MPSPPVARPHSKAALLADARRIARRARGRAAFMRDDRLLRVGVPLGCTFAVLGYAGRRRAGGSPAEAAAAAVSALAGTLVLTAAVALAEWTLTTRRA